MEFREFSENRSIQRPSIDHDDLDDAAPAFKGDVDMAMELVAGGSAVAASGSGRIERSVINGVDMSETRLRPLVLADVTVRGANLANAAWSEVTARRAEFESCRATGWRLGLTLAQDVYLADCRMDFAQLDIGNAKGLVVFERCNLTETLISGNLSRAVFLDCDLSGAEFEVSAARGCDLRGATLDGATGLLSMRGARVTGDQVRTIAGDLAEAVGLAVE